jgi:hypothetical protein
MSETLLRENLTELLKMGSAHVTLSQALAGLKPENRNLIVHSNCHTIWEELEHIRLAQEDILHYILYPEWKSPPWPEGYWPDKLDFLSDEQWETTVEKFNGDMIRLIELIENLDIDLTAQLPHSKNHTYLREILLVADHNSYHLGKIVQIRKILNNW